WPHWLDHRILGTVAGDIRWNNGLVNREDVYAWMLRNRNTPYAYDPTKRLFFMYNAADETTASWLDEQFPGGVHVTQPILNRTELNFMTYITPAYGVPMEELPGWPY